MTVVLYLEGRGPSRVSLLWVGRITLRDRYSLGLRKLDEIAVRRTLLIRIVFLLLLLIMIMVQQQAYRFYTRYYGRA